MNYQVYSCCLIVLFRAFRGIFWVKCWPNTNPRWVAAVSKQVLELNLEFSTGDVRVLASVWRNANAPSRVLPTQGWSSAGFSILYPSSIPGFVPAGNSAEMLLLPLWPRCWGSSGWEKGWNHGRERRMGMRSYHFNRILIFKNSSLLEDFFG